MSTRAAKAAEIFAAAPFPWHILRRTMLQVRSSASSPLRFNSTRNDFLPARTGTGYAGHRPAVQRVGRLFVQGPVFQRFHVYIHFRRVLRDVQQ